jgi:hypothetical protein
MGGRSGPAGCRSAVREKEWLEVLRIFGIGKQDGQRILGRLGRTLLDDHEKVFGSYWRHTFGPSRSVMQILGKERRGLEIVGRRLRSRTNRPLYI